MIRKLFFIPFLVLAFASSGWGADQNIYLDNAGAGAGSEGDPYGEFSEINWTTGGANSIFDWVDGGDTVYINLKDDATWRETLTVGTNGASGRPITIQSYGSGADPIVNGAALYTPGTSWTATTTEPSGGLFASGLEDEVNAYTTDFDGKVEDGGCALTVSTTAGQFHSGAKGGSAVMDGANFNAYTHTTVASSGDIYVYMRFKVSDDWAVPAGASSIIVLEDGGTNLAQVRIQSGADGVVDFITYRLLADVFGDVYAGTPGEIEAGTWYEVEIRYYDGTGADGGGEIWLDGVSLGSDFTNNMVGNDTDKIYIGARDLNDADRWENGDALYFDDVKADTSRITTFAGGPTDSWYATATTEPQDVYFDTVMGTEESAVANLNAAREWIWLANVLYCYSATDPDTAYTSPGLEGTIRDYCIRSDTKNYINYYDLELKYSQLEGLSIYRGSNHTAQDIKTYDHGYNREAGEFPAGVRANGTSNVTFTRITAYNAGWNGVSVVTWSATGDCSVVVVEYCESHDNIHQGLDFKANNNGALADITSRFNWTYDNGSQGQHFEDAADKHLSNVKLHGNLSNGNYACGFYVWKGDGAAIDTVLVYNNTAFDNGQGGYGAGFSGEITNGTFRNNIFFENQVNGNNDGELRADDEGGAANTSNYNLVYHTTHPDIFSWDAAPRTFAEQQGAGQEANSKNEDPDFVDSANDDFRLKINSPCILTGTDVGAGSTYKVIHPHPSNPGFGAGNTPWLMDPDIVGWPIGAYGYYSKPIIN